MRMLKGTLSWLYFCWQCQRHSYGNITTLSVFEWCTPTGLLVPVYLYESCSSAQVAIFQGNAALSDSDVKSKYIMILRAIQAQCLGVSLTASSISHSCSSEFSSGFCSSFHQRISRWNVEWWKHCERALQYKAETVFVRIQYLVFTNL